MVKAIDNVFYCKFQSKITDLDIGGKVPCSSIPTLPTKFKKVERMNIFIIIAMSPRFHLIIEI